MARGTDLVTLPTSHLSLPVTRASSLVPVTRAPFPVPVTLAGPRALLCGLCVPSPILVPSSLPRPSWSVISAGPRDLLF